MGWSILVVDDEATAREGLELTLAGEGYSVRQAASGAEALELLRQSPSDLVITDLKMPGLTGLDVLSEVRKLYPDLDVIVITGFATVDSAIQSMKMGAFDYLTKPFNLDAVRQVVKRALEKRRLEHENVALKRELARLGGLDGIVGRSTPMHDVFDMVRQVAPSSATVLITGESGTGKELIARSIHYNSPRAPKRFLPLNCAALSESLLENELFGHEKGAYTDARERKEGLFEAANGTTIFLDEIGEISQAMQVRLLRVLQEREVTRVGGTAPVKVDFRLVAATNRDLEKQVASGAFRADLFYRLNVITVRLPALRDRRDDVPLLVQHFFEKFRSQEGKKVQGLSAKAMEILCNYSWPGNVRELANVIERAVILTRDNEIGQEDLPPALSRAKPDEPSDLHSLEDHERDYIQYVLSRSSGNLTRASKILGMDRTTLWRKLKKYGLKESEGE
jgi:DNA-binding NtrC family response regulator